MTQSNEETVIRVSVTKLYDDTPKTILVNVQQLDQTPKVVTVKVEKLDPAPRTIAVAVTKK